MPEVAIVVKAKDQASATLGKVGGSLTKLGKVAAVAGAAGVAALGGIAVGASKLAYDAAMLEPVTVTFDNLTASIGSTADAMLDRLRPATMGVVSDADLMQAANKLMAMGLAETEDEAAKLSEMAVKLGTAMGEDATASMENFALMLANQSIPRLDSFGISSGKVRERINELMEADKDLTRETAFMTAVMEQGEAAMGKVGDVSGTGAVAMQQLGAMMDNLKMTVGQALLPVLKNLLANVVTPLVNKITEWIPIIQDKLTPAMEKVGTDVGPKVAEIFGKIWDWLDAYLIPAIKTLWDWTSAYLIPALRALASWVMDSVVPAIQRLFEWVADNLAPIFQEFADEMAPRFQEMLETIGEFIMETLVPALKDFWERTEGIRESIVAFMGSAAVQGLKAFLEGLVVVWDAVGEAIGRVRDAISWLIEKIQAAIAALQNLWGALPGWLTGSTASMAISTPMIPAYAPAGASTTNIYLGGVYAQGDIPSALEEAISYAARYAL